MTEENDSRDDTRIQLEELYLARKVSLETIRDCSTHSCARVDYAFILEIITLIYKDGIDLDKEIEDLRIRDPKCAESLEAFRMNRVAQIVRDTVAKPTPQNQS